MNNNFIKYEKVDSTNLKAIEYASTNKLSEDALKSGFVFISKSQSEGQGSYSKSWESQEGGLYYTFLIKTPKEKLSQSDVSTIVGNIGVKTAQLLTVYTGKNVSHKPPNDLFIHQKKIGGIRIDRTKSGQIPCLVIGIGINFNQEQLPENIKNIATSFFIELKQKIDIENFVELLTKDLVEALSNPTMLSS